MLCAGDILEIHLSVDRLDDENLIACLVCHRLYNHILRTDNLLLLYISLNEGDKLLAKLLRLTCTYARDVLHLLDSNRVVDSHIGKRWILEDDIRRQVVFLCHLLAQILEHCIELLVGSTAVCRGYTLVLLILVVTILGYAHNGRTVDKLLTGRGDGDKSVVLDIFVDKSHNKTLTHYSIPEVAALLGTDTEKLTIVVPVTLDNGCGLTQQQRYEVVNLELVADTLQRLECRYKLLCGICSRTRVAAVVAVAAIILGILLSEVVEQCSAAAHAALGIRLGLKQQQLTNLLLGNRLTLHKFLQLLDVLIIIKGKAETLATITTGTTGLLIVALERLRNIVVDYKTHIGLVDAHTEGDSCHNNIGTLLEEGILIVGTGLCIHTCVVRQRLDAVCNKQLGKLLNLLAAQAVDNTALALILLDKADDVAVRIVLRSQLIVEVWSVERALEDGGVGHTEVLLNIHLHLRRSCCRKGDERSLANIVYNRTDTTVLRAEVVTPLRDTVCLVNGVERDLDLVQKGDIVLLGQRLGGKVEQLGLTGKYIFAHLLHSILCQ